MAPKRSKPSKRDPAWLAALLAGPEAAPMMEATGEWYARCLAIARRDPDVDLSEVSRKGPITRLPGWPQARVIYRKNPPANGGIPRELSGFLAESDAIHDSMLARAAAQAEREMAMAIPLVSEWTIHGIMDAVNRARAEGFTFTDEELKYIRKLGEPELERIIALA